MVNKILKKGWLVEIDSWENDGDFRSTATFNITFVEELNFLVALFPYFQKSAHERGPNGEEGYYVGNIFEPSEAQVERVNEVVKRCLVECWPDHPYFDEDEQCEGIEWLDMYDSAFVGMEGGQFTRKISAFRVYEIPEQTEFRLYVRG